MNPPSFEPEDYPPSFEPDTQALSIIPPVTLNLPAHLQEELDNAIYGDQPSLLFGWFERLRIESQGKTNLARAQKISSMAGMVQAYAALYEQGIKNHRLPQTLHRQHQLEDGVHRQTLLTLDNEYKTAIIAHHLIELAAKQGLPLDLYLIKLSNEISLDLKEKQDELDLKKQEELKRIEREHDRQHYHNKIMNARLAKNEALQLTRQVMEEIDKLHTEIDELERDTKISATLKQNKIANRKENLSFWEEQRGVLRKRFGATGTEEDA